MTLILRDMCLDGRQFGHLMPPRLTLCGSVSRVCAESAIAVAAMGRKQLNDLIDAARWRQPAPVSAMPRLAARLAPTLFSFTATLAWLTSQSVGRRWFGRGDR